MKLSRKLPLIVISSICAPLLIVAAISYVELRHQTVQQKESQLSSLHQQLSGRIQNYIKMAVDDLRMLAEDPITLAYVRTQDPEQRVMLMQRPLLRKFSSLQRVKPDYIEVKLFTQSMDEELNLVAGPNRSASLDLRKSDVLAEISSQTAPVYSRFIFDKVVGESRLLVSYRLRSPAGSVGRRESYGHLVMVVALTQLHDMVQRFPWQGGGLVLTREQGQVIVATETLRDDAVSGSSDLSESLSILIPGLQRTELHDNPYQHAANLVVDDVWLHAFVPENVMLEGGQRVRQVVLWVAVGGLLFAVPLVLVTMRRSVIEPITELNQAFEKMGNHHELVEVEEPGRNELGDLGHAFNRMSKQLFESHRKIRNLAYHDPLTGLPNRMLFNKSLNRIMRRARRNGSKVALLFVDIDNFKHINDGLGHHAGDMLLEEIARRLVNRLRAQDCVARYGEHTEVSRLGGDEFTIILNELDHVCRAGEIAQRVVEAVAEPIHVNGKICYVGASVGIAFYPGDGMTVEDLLKNADMAMYQAKHSGKGHFQYFSRNIAQESSDRVELDQRLHIAVDNKAFRLVYQPIVDSRTGDIVSAEALIRWHDEKMGQVSPDRFIPLAEENRLILPIGHWVLENVCRQLVEWREQGLDNIRVGINVSAVQLNQPGIAEQVALLLQRNQLSSDKVYIELTETAVLNAEKTVTENLNLLRQMGIQVALDDFGTGYSSLSYLRTLPIDVLKIDRSFVRNLDNESDRAIIAAIIEMAHALKLKVVAEGVEEQVHAEYIRDQGGDLQQGYLFSPPVEAAELRAMVQRRRLPKMPGGKVHYLHNPG